MYGAEQVARSFVLGSKAGQGINIWTEDFESIELAGNAWLMRAQAQVNWRVVGQERLRCNARSGRKGTRKREDENTRVGE